MIASPVPTLLVLILSLVLWVLIIASVWTIVDWAR